MTVVLVVVAVMNQTLMIKRYHLVKERKGKGNKTVAVKGDVINNYIKVYNIIHRLIYILFC